MFLILASHLYNTSSKNKSLLEDTCMHTIYLGKTKFLVLTSLFSSSSLPLYLEAPSLKPKTFCRKSLQLITSMVFFLLWKFAGASLFLHRVLQFFPRWLFFINWLLLGQVSLLEIGKCWKARQIRRKLNKLQLISKTVDLSAVSYQSS